jgi:hypothetical protein
MKIEKFEYWNLKSLYEISYVNLLFHNNDASTNLDLTTTTNHENTIITTLAKWCTKMQSTFAAPPINWKNQSAIFQFQQHSKRGHKTW